MFYFCKDGIGLKHSIVGTISSCACSLSLYLLGETNELSKVDENGAL
jgi:hypothetical protein